MVSPHSVVFNVLDYDIVESEFELKSRKYFHFQTNTFREGMNPLSSLGMG